MGFIHLISERELTSKLMLESCQKALLPMTAVSPWLLNQAQVREVSSSAAVSRAISILQMTTDPVAIMVDSGVSSAFPSATRPYKEQIEQSLLMYTNDPNRFFVETFDPNVEIVFLEAAGEEFAKYIGVSPLEFMINPRASVAQWFVQNKPDVDIVELDSLQYFVDAGILSLDQIMQSEKFVRLAHWLESSKSYLKSAA